MYECFYVTVVTQERKKENDLSMKVKMIFLSIGIRNLNEQETILDKMKEKRITTCAGYFRCFCKSLAFQEQFTSIKGEKELDGLLNEY